MWVIALHPFGHWIPHGLLQKQDAEGSQPQGRDPSVVEELFGRARRLLWEGGSLRAETLKAGAEPVTSVASENGSEEAQLP